MGNNTNDITGDMIKTKVPSQQYRDNYDLIFGKKKQEQKEEPKKEDKDGL